MGCGLGVNTRIERLIAERLVGKRVSYPRPNVNEEVFRNFSRDWPFNCSRQWPRCWKQTALLKLEALRSEG